MTHINFNRLWFISRTEGSALKKLGGPTGRSSQLRAVVLTHFNINRSDYLPRLVEGFRGPVYATPRTLGADGYGAVISNSNAERQTRCAISYKPLGRRSREIMAEGARFELAAHEVGAGFQDRWIKPLSHPSEKCTW